MSEVNKYFGSPTTRAIWGNLDNILLIYVGSAADFPLCKENHWLFFTGCLPKEPQKRFLETFSYNQKLFFTPKEQVIEIIDKIKCIHRRVEQERSRKEKPMKISNQGYLEVLFMLTDYGIKGYEYLRRRKLSEEEKTEYIKDMKTISELMGVKDFPTDNQSFQTLREESIQEDLLNNEFTKALYKAYLSDLGALRYWVLLHFQKEFIDKTLSNRLFLKRNYFFVVIYKIYPYLNHRLVLRLVLKLLLKRSTIKGLKSNQHIKY